MINVLEEGCCFTVTMLYNACEHTFTYPSSKTHSSENPYESMTTYPSTVAQHGLASLSSRKEEEEELLSLEDSYYQLDCMIAV